MEESVKLDENLTQQAVKPVHAGHFKPGYDARRELIHSPGRKPTIMRAKTGLDMLGVETAPEDMIAEIQTDWPGLKIPPNPSMFWLIWARLWVEAAKGSQWAIGFVVGHTTGLPKPVADVGEVVPEAIRLELRADEIPLEGLSAPNPSDIIGELSASTEVDEA